VFGRGNALLYGAGAVVEALARLRVRAPVRSIPAGPIGRHLARRRALWESTAFKLGLAFWAAGSYEPDVLADYGARAFDRANVLVLLRMMRMGATRTFTSDDGAVDYAARFFELDRPLLVVAGTRDRIATPKSVKPAFDGSRARHRSYREFPDGHADLVTGRHAPSRSWRAVHGFLLAH
jgi:pimeloyl-ACP methyl ester carboxylesterase